MSKPARIATGIALIAGWILLYAFMQDKDLGKPVGVLGVIPLLIGFRLIFMSSGGANPKVPNGAPTATIERENALKRYGRRAKQATACLFGKTLSLLRSEMYSKVVQIVIAACLLWLCFVVSDLASGKGRSIPVEITNYSLDVKVDEPLEVEVTNNPSVDVSNTVEIEGTVSIAR